MKLNDLVTYALDKTNFLELADYIKFCEMYMEFVENGIQARIVSQNENVYHFFQYKGDGHFNVTRLLNSELIYDATTAEDIHHDLETFLHNARDLGVREATLRTNAVRAIYMLQQSIGATLDALPGGKTNSARKINGDLFERLIQIVVREVGLRCDAGVVRVPVVVNGIEQCTMSYQHDLLISDNDTTKIVGSVKTSSKDRIDKIFMEKFLYNKLTCQDLPHVAVFLNDVQRKKTKKEGVYGVSATFLPGHFKGFTLKLNPLDGVYYCDIRPNMRTDPLLAAHIKTIDWLFTDDSWSLVSNS